jgi:hypothetical protein
MYARLGIHINTNNTALSSLMTLLTLQHNRHIHIDIFIHTDIHAYTYMYTYIYTPPNVDTDQQEMPL